MSDIDQLKMKRICSGCVGEAYLKALIECHGNRVKCDYCGHFERTLNIDVMADKVETAFEQHYERSPTDPDALEWMMLGDKELEYDWVRKGQMTVYAILDAAQIDEEPAKDLQKVLAERHANSHSWKAGEETEFASDAFYIEKQPNPAEYQADWLQFEQQLKTQTRFFSRDAMATLNVVFHDITELKARNGRKVVINAGPGTKHSAFFRARAFENDHDLEDALKYPEQRLGPPPSSSAKDGRMNARGIAVYYGASDAKTAIAEVRPPVGSRVLVGRFDVVAPLKLLDLRALEQIDLSGSIFDPGYIHHLERAAFLSILSKRITMPVMPSDEAAEYLPTQAIADFLATEADPRLDGIIYPSVQTGKKHFNVVLFNKAARVQPSDAPPGTETTASLYQLTEEGQEISYWISEEVPDPSKKGNDGTHFTGLGLFSIKDRDDRRTTLKLVPSSLAVHHIKSIVIKDEIHRVMRFRSVKSDEDPGF